MGNEFSKNEKGTQGAPNSSKNHYKYIKSVSANVLKISENFLNGLFRRYNYLSDPNLIRENESLIREFQVIKRVIEADPRLPWQSIQCTIDDMYKKDKNLKGVRLEIVFSDLKKNDNKTFNPFVYGIPS